MTTPQDAPESSDDLLAISPVLPVVGIQDVERAVPLARALARGGIDIIEITLRTTAGIAAIERVAAEVPEIVIGAGTVTSPEQAETVRRAGAQFIVTPGSPERLVDAVLDTGLPLLAGAATLTEIMRLFERGLTAMKFFPAESAGGPPHLAAIAGPIPQVRFCPTGGITASNAKKYLRLGNVDCVGGSWLTPSDVVAAGHWQRIESLAAAAVALA